jgi:hypothetical protein
VGAHKHRGQSCARWPPVIPHAIAFSLVPVVCSPADSCHRVCHTRAQHCQCRPTVQRECHPASTHYWQRGIRFRAPRHFVPGPPAHKRQVCLQYLQHTSDHSSNGSSGGIREAAAWCSGCRVNHTGSASTAGGTQHNRVHPHSNCDG